MMAEPTFVAVPAWAMWMLGVFFVAFLGWAINDRVKVGEMLTKIRVRLGNIETLLKKKLNGGDE